MLQQNINQFGQAVFIVLANEKQESSLAAMFLSDRNEMKKLYKGLSIDNTKY